MPRGTRRTPRPGASRQKKHAGGSFYSERQRRYMWKFVPQAAKKWAHNRHTTKSDWMRRSAGVGAHSGMSGAHGMGFSVKNRSGRSTSTGRKRRKRK